VKTDTDLNKNTTNDNKAPEYEVKTDDNNNKNQYNSNNNKVPE